MELFNFYSLDECLNTKLIKKTLTSLEKEGKVEFSIESDILKIKDLDLDENEINDLVELFDENDVFPYPDYQEDDEDDDYYGGDFDDYNEDDDY
jgi:hypothetical protein